MVCKEVSGQSIRAVDTTVTSPSKSQIWSAIGRTIGQLFAVGPDSRKGFSQLDGRGEGFLETTVNG